MVLMQGIMFDISKQSLLKPSVLEHSLLILSMSLLDGFANAIVLEPSELLDSNLTDEVLEAITDVRDKGNY
jgi:hypothetical protein